MTSTKSVRIKLRAKVCQYICVDVPEGCAGAVNIAVPEGFEDLALEIRPGMGICDGMQHVRIEILITDSQDVRLDAGSHQSNLWR